MKVFHGEFAHDYSTYSFGYEIHADMEKEEDPRGIYEHGFLPRSNDPSLHNRFYMARSVRVPVDRFSPSSENRRILKKFDGRFTRTLLSRGELQKNENFKKLFLTYFDTKHSVGIMSEERLRGILESTLPVRGVCYLDEEKPIAYALEVRTDSFIHYWYPVYDVSEIGTSLGMWLMLDVVRRAKEEGSAYVYLGTAYGEKGCYKLNIEQLEYWDGESWNPDRRSLKTLINKERSVTHIQP